MMLQLAFGIGVSNQGRAAEYSMARSRFFYLARPFYLASGSVRSCLLSFLTFVVVCIGFFSILRFSTSCVSPLVVKRFHVYGFETIQSAACCHD